MSDRSADVAGAIPQVPSAAGWRETVSPAIAMLGSLLAMVRRRRLAFAIPALLVPLLAGIAIAATTPSYTAKAAVIYDPSGYAMRELQSILRSDPTTDAIMASQLEILRGLRMAEQLATRLDLARFPEFNPTLRDPSWPRRLLTAAAQWIEGGGNPQTETEMVADTVQRAIDAKTLKTSRVVEISFTAADPLRAAQGANAIAEIYFADQLAAKTDAVRRADAWLVTRVADLRREVTAGEDRIAAYRAQSGLVSGVQAALPTERISRLTADLASARDTLAAAEARLQSVRGGETGAGGAAIAPSVVALRAQADQLSGQLKLMMARFGTRHPFAIGLRAQLADVRRAVKAETDRIVAAMTDEVASDHAHVLALESELGAAQDEVGRAAEAQVPLNAMQRDVDASRTLLQAVLERVQQTAQQTAIEAPDARFVSEALPPEHPSSPRSLLILPAATMLGLCFGLLRVYWLDAGDESFPSGDAVRATLALPCLALVPELRADRRRRVEDHVVETPLSPFSEQIRALLAGLWTEGAAGRVIAITAARPAEGKTTIAVALGRLAALNGDRAIVLDCDVRQPSFGRLMRADSGIGLTECLLGHVSPAQAIRTDELTGLDYMPAGSADTNSLALFQSAAMAALLDDLRAEYRLVILDAPPAFAMADARVIARAADATLLCVRWRDTPRRVVQHALEILRDARAELAGVALTRVNVRAHGRSGYADSEVYQARYGGYFRD
ncbi:MAG: AAA family ATPase [Acetobacteraceae bacterium]|nr:AAA family ATPase [Acetobacteraceae bacterium]